MEPIARICAKVDVPVIGNGDVRTPQDAKRMLSETGCQGVMVGRAFLGNPWLAREILTYLESGEELPPSAIDERIAFARRHLQLVVEQRGERRELER